MQILDVLMLPLSTDRRANPRDHSFSDKHPVEKLRGGPLRGRDPSDGPNGLVDKVLLNNRQYGVHKNVEAQSGG